MSGAGPNSPAFPTRRYPLQGGEVTILDIKFVSQRPPSMFCVVASMKMCWDYIRQTVGAGRKPEDAPDLTFEDIRHLTRTDEYTGTVIDEGLMRGFTEVQNLVQATLAQGIDLPTLRARAARGLPAVAMYYPSVARDPQSEVPGVGHACVFLGYTEIRSLIHNPWLGPFTQWPTNDFEWSRKRLADHAIIFDLKPKKVVVRPLDGGPLAEEP